MKPSQNPRLLFTHLRSRLAAPQRGGESFGMPSEMKPNPIHKMEFGDQVSISVMEDVEVQLPPSFVESTESLGYSAPVTVKPGTFVDNVASTRDTIQFSTPNNQYEISEYLVNDEMHYAMYEVNENGFDDGFAVDRLVY